MVDYWERLKPELDARGMDVTALAKALKISFQAVAKVRDGGKFGSENNLKAAKLFGLSPEWLATGIGAKRPQAPVNLPPLEDVPKTIEGFSPAALHVAAMFDWLKEPRAEIQSEIMTMILSRYRRDQGDVPEDPEPAATRKALPTGKPKKAPRL